jgi:hypothetical protein
MTDETMALRQMLVRRDLLGRDDRLCRPAPDATGGGRGDRRRPWRAQSRPPGAAQRLPPPRLADPRRHGRAADPEASARLLLPRLPGAQENLREGADGGDPGSLCPGHLDPLGGRAGPRQGHGGGEQEPSLPALRRDRRAGARLPHPPHRGVGVYADGPISGSTPPEWRSARQGVLSPSPRPSRWA